MLQKKETGAYGTGLLNLQICIVRDLASINRQIYL